MDKEKTPEASRRLAIVYLGAGGFGAWPVVSSPGVPVDRVKILSEAHAKTMKEPELLGEANKREWDLKPVAGEELEALAKEVIAQPPEVIERMKKLLEK